MRLLLLSILFCVCATSVGYGDSQLNRISASAAGSSVKVFAFFDKLPIFNERVSQKRLDITLSGTVTTETLRLPEPDDTIVKTLLLTDQDKTILSFFFRYVPQDIKVAASEANTLIIEVVPGNRFTQTFKELSADLGGVSVVASDAETKANPLTFSAYAADWTVFFRDFEITSQIKPTPSFYFPDFPLVALSGPADFPQVSIAPELQNSLSQKNWFDALRQIQNLIKDEADARNRIYLALIHADILFRIGSVKAAYAQFQMLSETFADDNAGNLARYALALIDAQSGNFYKAYIELDKLNAAIELSSSLSPHLRLSLAETALATENYQQAAQLLTDSVTFPASLAELKQFRQADLLFATSRLPEAFRIYQGLMQDLETISQPLSLNAYCSILYRDERFADSARCYRSLAAILESEEQKASALFLEALSRLKGTPTAPVETALLEIIERFPGSEAANKSELKLADLCFLNQQDCTVKALQTYDRLAELSRFRRISEEAAFKQALVLHLSAADEKSVEHLMRLLRNSRTGEVRNQAETLLIQILPGVIEGHLLNGDDIKAISLAQQNRVLFQNRWIVASLLFKLGLAFERLGLNEEALRLFLYLRSLDEAEAKEEIYLALSRTAHAIGNHYLVEEFSSDYFYLYPDGRFYQDILFYRIDSMYAEGLVDQASDLLPQPLPDRDDYKVLAASIHFHNNDYRQAIDLLQTAAEADAVLNENRLYIIAESLFRSGKLSESESFYRKLVVSDTFKAFALYRLAQAAMTAQDRREQTLIEEIEADSEDPLWQRFASLELRLNQLTSNL